MTTLGRVVEINVLWGDGLKQLVETEPSRIGARVLLRFHVDSDLNIEDVLNVVDVDVF